MPPGLPNIVGAFSYRPNAEGTTFTGAFRTGTTNTNMRVTGTGETSLKEVDVSLDASKSNRIYGNSTTVQPPAFALIPQIRY